MENMIKQFAADVSAGNVEIYNEFSLRHELGVHFRDSIQGKKVQFERNLSFFGLKKSEYLKREIDISVFSGIEYPGVAVELKYPRNGQYPDV